MRTWDKLSIILDIIGLASLVLCAFLGETLTEKLAWSCAAIWCLNVLTHDIIDYRYGTRD